VDSETLLLFTISMVFLVIYHAYQSLKLSEAVERLEKLEKSLQDADACQYAGQVGFYTQRR
jgi:hypothetical protein